jgi:hypothetical protein
MLTKKMFAESVMYEYFVIHCNLNRNDIVIERDFQVEMLEKKSNNMYCC